WRVHGDGERTVLPQRDQQVVDLTALCRGFDPAPTDGARGDGEQQAAVLDAGRDRSGQAKAAVGFCVGEYFGVFEHVRVTEAIGDIAPGQQQARVGDAAPVGGNDLTRVDGAAHQPQRADIDLRYGCDL